MGFPCKAEPMSAHHVDEIRLVVDRSGSLKSGVSTTWWQTEEQFLKKTNCQYTFDLSLLTIFFEES